MGRLRRCLESILERIRYRSPDVFKAELSADKYYLIFVDPSQFSETAARKLLSWGPSRFDTSTGQPLFDGPTVRVVRVANLKECPPQVYELERDLVDTVTDKLIR